ncbi:MAG: dihydroorotase [Dehalococcoidales bacterium]|nr:MAG: dihydroorotase [Dehalococcoidales bacterium]
MKALLLYGGRIIDPGQGIDEVGNLLVNEGRVLWRGSVEMTPPVSDYDALSVEGLVVCPGFIDLHCHLRQPGFEEKETIASGSSAAARGGFTTICCMPNTNPPLDNPAAVDYVKEIAAREAVVRVLPVGCVSRGRKGEMLAPLVEMASTGVVGFSDDGAPVSNPPLMKQALEYSRVLDLPVIDHCQDISLTRDGQVNEGVISARLGLKGMPAAAEENMVIRDLSLTRQTGGWLHVAHITTEGSVNLVRRAREQGINVTAEVTPHHLTLTEEAVDGYNTSAKVNPPLRTGRDIQALIGGLKDDVIDIIATDHAPHTVADKQCEFTRAEFGISGFETALGSLMALVHSGELTLTILIARLTAAPARIIGERYGKLGTLAVGAVADITVFDPERDWVVDTNAFASKGKNTPLDGATLKGKVMATIAQGSLVYKDDSIKAEVKDFARR